MAPSIEETHECCCCTTQTIPIPKDSDERFDKVFKCLRIPMVFVSVMTTVLPVHLTITLAALILSVLLGTLLCIKYDEFVKLNPFSQEEKEIIAYFDLNVYRALLSWMVLILTMNNFHTSNFGVWMVEFVSAVSAFLVAGFSMCRWLETHFAK